VFSRVGLSGPAETMQVNFVDSEMRVVDMLVFELARRRSNSAICAH
jgi:hypothetical protein